MEFGDSQNALSRPKIPAHLDSSSVHNSCDKIVSGCYLASNEINSYIENTKNNHVCEQQQNEAS